MAGGLETGASNSGKEKETAKKNDGEQKTEEGYSSSSSGWSTETWSMGWT